MFRSILAGVLAGTAMLAGCAVDTKPTEPGMSRSFRVPNDSVMTAENVIPAIFDAAHDSLVTACEQAPEKAVHIVDPLASMSYADVACSDVLEGDRQTNAALTRNESEGATGQAQDKLTPLGPLLCGLTALGASFAASTACGDVKATERNLCRYSLLGSDVGWLVVCTFMF